MDKRNWIMDQTLVGQWAGGFCADGKRIDPGNQKILVIDDDVRFYRVDELTLDTPGREVQGYRFLPSCRHDLREMVSLISMRLDDYAHVGVVRRYGAHQMTQPFTLNAKCLHVLGYNLARFPKPFPRYRLTTGSDVDYQLQLTSLAGSCFLTTEFCHEEAPMHRAGGCALWRTPQLIAEGMSRLQALWPDYVFLRTDSDGTTACRVALKKLALDHGHPGVPAQIEEAHRAHVAALEAKRRSLMTEEQQTESDRRQADASTASRERLRARMDAMTPSERKEFRRQRREVAELRKKARTEQMKAELRLQLMSETTQTPIGEDP
jgi:hypothetical protein